jgi:SnoaL-like domain
MPDPLTPGDGQDVLARLKRALEKRDPDLGVELFSTSADARFDPFEPSITDRNGLRAWWNEMAASRAHQEFDAERVWVAGRTVLASWHGAYTTAGTSERIRVRGFITLELGDAGLVERLRLWAISRTVGVDGRHEPAEAPGTDTEVASG